MIEKAIQLNITPIVAPSDSIIFTNYVYVGRDSRDIYVDFHVYDVNSANRKAAETMALTGAETVSLDAEAPTVARLVMSPTLAQTLARLLQDYTTADKAESE